MLSHFFLCSSIEIHNIREITKNTNIMIALSSCDYPESSFKVPKLYRDNGTDVILINK